jgi:SAM-dependent methyltransferase
MRLFEFARSQASSATARDCPVCAGSRATSLGHLKKTFLLDLSRDEWEFAQCKRCDLLFISPEPSAADLQTIYVDSGQFDDAAYTDPARIALIVDYMDSCFRRMVERSGRRAQDRVNVLEVGGGLAWMCRAAKAVNRDNSTVAQDISPEAVDQCPWVDEYVLGDIQDPRLDRRAPYDVISLTHVIEHLVDPVDVIRRCKSLLCARGVIFVTAPHRPIGWKDGASDIALWETYSYNHVPAHIQYFSKKSMRALAERSGCVLDHWSDTSEDGQAFEAWLR